MLPANVRLDWKVFARCKQELILPRCLWRRRKIFATLPPDLQVLPLLPRLGVAKSGFLDQLSAGGFNWELELRYSFLFKLHLSFKSISAQLWRWQIYLLCIRMTHTTPTPAGTCLSSVWQHRLLGTRKRTSRGQCYKTFRGRYFINVFVKLTRSYLASLSSLSPSIKFVMLEPTTNN